MGDYILDWNESSMNIDISNHGIPIPRSQHSQSYLRPEFSSQGYLYDNESPSPSRPPLVPPNSLVMNFNNSSPQFLYPSENQRMTLSPFNSSGSPFMLSNNVDDIEIKIEPLEELLEISGMAQNSEPSHPPEDNLLDNVNFEDLLMTDDMDSSTTTCLDPQHSSPAAMATVHPDEVLGLMRNDNYNSPHISQSFTPSINVPVKNESISLGGFATSFPPQGIGWKDPIQSDSSHNQSNYQSNDNRETQQNPFLKESTLENHQTSRILVLESDHSPSQNIHQRIDEPDISSYINNNNKNNTTFYTSLESCSNSTNSALHDLLVNSPSISHSPHQVQHQQQLQHHQQQQQQQQSQRQQQELQHQQQPQHQQQQQQQQQQQKLQQLSPSSGNLSPASPIRGFSVQEIPVGQSVPGAPSFLTNTSSNLSSRLSSSAPANDFSLENIWQRREPRQHLLSTGSLAEEVGGSTSSLSTGGGILSPIPHDLSIDEGADSDEESDGDHYESDSDNDSIMSEEMSTMNQSGKKERHFWQYNVQAKGPKGQRVSITQSETDPHQLDKIMDPVFSPLCSIQGIKHSGKARRGDGNDLTPSPKKLVTIGVELNKLNKKINEMTPVSELPSTVRSKSRKEKNKLASRACRLKKKAQHEANKIKLYGLEQEHRAMIALINKAKEELVRKLDLASGNREIQRRNCDNNPSSTSSSPKDSLLIAVGSPEGSCSKGEDGASDSYSYVQHSLTSHIEKAAKMRTKQRIAGFTTEFVNKVIENCRTGNPTGGLDELSHTFVKSSLSSSTSESGGLNYNNELYT